MNAEPDAQPDVQPDVQEDSSEDEEEPEPADGESVAEEEDDGAESDAEPWPKRARRPVATPVRGEAGPAEDLRAEAQEDEDMDHDEDEAEEAEEAEEEAEEAEAKVGNSVEGVSPFRSPATPGRSSLGESSKATPARAATPRMWGRPSATPGTSPRTMQLNDKVETCLICYNDAPPLRAVRLRCHHGWYCAQCILRHAEARLEQGHATVVCPECGVELAERELRKMLPTEVIERLLARSLEQVVSSTSDLWACPTPNCPMRVALEEGEIPRLKCTLCNKVSCLRCGRQPYHRGRTCEEFAEYQRSTRQNKKDMLKQQDEESLRKWLEETGAKQCPTCRMAITKQNLGNQSTQYSECHKMFCRNCNTKFCFKCLTVFTDTVTCNCTRKEHGFVDPRTGKRVAHQVRKVARSKTQPKLRAK